MKHIINKIDSIKYLNVFLGVFFIHFLHQIEESLSFFNWYNYHYSNLGSWAILPASITKLVIKHPNYFILASFLQFLLIFTLAFISKHYKNGLKSFSTLYIIGLDFFLIWHILSCYNPHIYPPVMVTCILGLFYTPKWIYSLYK
ncbi:HXXEE domain-containing protein [Streptococcus downei]|uniref:HXXEE domain-containing protein n=1 Tax=Streptococcus downei MFe28 TaxID=764290 RepID=A0A380JCF0_STRDO|nr:Uncharacterised protein [Streptococcus downei MFe28]